MKILLKYVAPFSEVKVPATEEQKSRIHQIIIISSTDVKLQNIMKKKGQSVIAQHGESY